MTGDEFDDDDVPWASPEIRQSYEAALGFILEFNQVDNLLGEVIETVLNRFKRDDLAAQCARWPFWQKLLVFDLLKSSTEGVGLSSDARCNTPADLVSAGSRPRGVLPCAAIRICQMTKENRLVC